MSDDPIANATQRLAQIKTEIGTLQAEQREIENALAVLRRFRVSLRPDHFMPASSINPGVAEAIEARARHAVSQGFQMSQAEFEVLAVRAIEEAERPMTRTQLLQWMENNGTPMIGADASKNVGTKLWRARDRFVNIRGAGYWFKDRPYPAANYFPPPPDLPAACDYDPDFPKVGTGVGAVP